MGYADWLDFVGDLFIIALGGLAGAAVAYLLCYA